MKRIKDYLTIGLFSATILGFAITFLVTPDKDVSKSERRKLALFPEVSAQTITDNKFSDGVEGYILDQFPLRDALREVNAKIRYYLLGQEDVNGHWLKDGSIIKNPEPLSDNQVAYGVNIINKVRDTYLNGMNVYYTVIPDKSYYVGDTNSPKLDHDRMLEILHQGVNEGEYINIFDTLSLEDYYKTDSHWMQDRLFPTRDAIANAMGVGDVVSEATDFKVNKLEPFYGVYWGQSLLAKEPDKLNYLTNEYTETSRVYGIDPEVLKNQFGITMELDENVYALDKFEGIDGYDVFLSGAHPLVVIETPNANTDRELVIFRDSFGSSIAPLFTGAYKKITLIDLRYFPSALLGEYVDFNEGSDALFLFSAGLLNSSMLMR